MPKIGLSSYSLCRAVIAGKLDIFGVIKWVAENIWKFPQGMRSS